MCRKKVMEFVAKKIVIEKVYDSVLKLFGIEESLRFGNKKIFK